MAVNDDGPLGLVGLRGGQRRHGHRGSGGADARGRRRQGQGGVAGQGLSGSALRRGEAELHPQAPLRRPPDRRRPRAGDRLAAAADFPEPQREDSARRGRLSGRVAERPHSRDSHRPDHARDGRRASARQSALLAGSGERPENRPGDSAEALVNEPRRRQLLRAARSRLRQAADRGREALGCDDGAVQGAEGGHVSQLVAEFCRAFPSAGRRLRRAAAGHSTVAVAHVRAGAGDEARSGEDRHGGTVFRFDHAERDWPRDRREDPGAGAVGRRRREHQDLFRSVRLRHQDADRRDQRSRPGHCRGRGPGRIWEPRNTWTHRSCSFSQLRLSQV